MIPVVCQCVFVRYACFYFFLFFYSESCSVTLKWKKMAYRRMDSPDSKEQWIVPTKKNTYTHTHRDECETNKTHESKIKRNKCLNRHEKDLNSQIRRAYCILHTSIEHSTIARSSERVKKLRLMLLAIDLFSFGMAAIFRKHF